MYYSWARGKEVDHVAFISGDERSFVLDGEGFALGTVYSAALSISLWGQRGVGSH